MRISTLQVFNSSLQNMLDQQARLLRSQEQVSSGLRMLKPSDDAIGAVRASDIESNRAVLQQYRDNATIAEAQLGLEETALAGVNSLLQRASELAIQSANATNSDESRGAIAVELRERLSELVDLANTRDAAGEFIFGGYQVSGQPFAMAGGSVSYSGDQGQRQLQVGEGTLVAVRDSGAEVFLSSPSGDGRAEVQVAGGNSGNLIVDGYSTSGSFVPADYTLSFSQPTAADPITWTVTSGSPPTAVAGGTWAEGDAIEFAGIQLDFVGRPADGDSIAIAPSSKRSIFDVIESLASALETPRTDAASGAVQQNAINRSLNELDQALTHINEIRASVGSRLNIVESQRSINEDFDFQLEVALSETRDLDYAEAISRFNAQLVSLQAAQQSYARVQDLSLFNYL
jgi:flagellar hook-associated protein 3 FlgL